MKNKRILQKIAREKKLVSIMVEIYCKNHHSQKKLCKDCNELIEYAYLRIDKCPFMETKSFCSNCQVHCYQKEKREKIREVMRFSGPRMLFHHPVIALQHVLSKWRKKK